MKIGIIGGGQLGMMMAEKAKELNHSVISLDPNPTCSITRFSDLHISKDYSDYEVLSYMYDNCDVITYEFENVDLAVLKKFEKKIPQKTKALELSRNRIVEKNYAKSLGIKTPEFKLVESKNDVFIPSIVKTTTGGYDGKGQYRVLGNSDIDHITNISEIEYICEEYIEFDYEISVVATRDYDGNLAVYPIPYNTHKNGILHISKVNNQIPKAVQKEAIKYTKLIMDDLDYIGTLAVEYFIQDDTVIFNEFAPRPHNSGHYTMDGCNVSQFYNHILAITGKNVIKPTLIKNTCMLNVLGQNKAYYDRALNKDSLFIHDYFKNSNKENRKIGHINFLYDNEDEYKNTLEGLLEE